MLDLDFTLTITGLLPEEGNGQPHLYQPRCRVSVRPSPRGAPLNDFRIVTEADSAVESMGPNLGLTPFPCFGATVRLKASAQCSG